MTSIKNFLVAALAFGLVITVARAEERSLELASVPSLIVEIQRTTSADAACSLIEEQLTRSSLPDTGDDLKKSFLYRELFEALSNGCKTRRLTIGAGEDDLNCRDQERKLLTSEQTILLNAYLQKVTAIENAKFSCLTLDEIEPIKIDVADVTYAFTTGHSASISERTSNIAIKSSHFQEVLIISSSLQRLVLNNSKVELLALQSITSAPDISIINSNIRDLIASQNKINSIVVHDTQLVNVNLSKNDIIGSLSLGRDTSLEIYQASIPSSAKADKQASDFLIGGAGVGTVRLADNKVGGTAEISYVNATALLVTNNISTSLTLRSIQLEALMVAENEIKKDFNFGFSPELENARVVSQLSYPLLLNDIQDGFLTFYGNRIGGNLRVFYLRVGSEERPLGLVKFSKTTAGSFKITHAHIWNAAPIDFSDSTVAKSFELECMFFNGLTASDLRSESFYIRATQSTRPIAIVAGEFKNVVVSYPRDGNVEPCGSSLKVAESRPTIQGDATLDRPKAVYWEAPGKFDNNLTSLTFASSRFRHLIVDAAVGELVVFNSRVEEVLSLIGRFSGEVDLSFTSINGVFFIDSPDSPVRWDEHSRLLLKGTTIESWAVSSCGIALVGCNQLNKGSWRPLPTLMDGVRIKNVLGPAALGADRSKYQRSILDLPSQNIIAWLTSWPKQFEADQFNPQPFASFARLLGEAGYRDAANDLNAYRTQMLLSQGDGILSSIKVSAGWAIGYGYKPDGLVIFLGCLIFFGWLMWLLLGHRQILKWVQDNHTRAASAGLLLLVFGPLLGATIRIFPNVAGFWSLTPSWEKRFGLVLSPHPYDHWYYILHSFTGVACLFLLVTPLTGMFD